MALLDADADRALVRIRDLAGRPRGTGFLADHHGTVVTSHEAVDGLARMVLQPFGEAGFADAFQGAAPPGSERVRLVDADAVTPLPQTDLALVHTEGLGFPLLAPLPIAAARPAAGAGVRLRANGWFDGTVVGTARGVTYTATDLFHLLDESLELTLGPDGREALRLGGQAAGGPVLDARTGAVLAVLGTSLHAGRRVGGFAVGLRAVAEADPRGALAAVLDRNAATVPAYGTELNLAGALQLTATSVGSAGRPRLWREPVERPDVVREFTRFDELGGGSGAGVLGLVGEPGTGRTTELAALAGRRARGARPAPTIWLRGADLRAGDDGVRPAVARALRSAGRIVAASASTAGDAGQATPDGVARLARAAGRPLYLVLDGPEERPSAPAHDLADWSAATARWLRTAGVRLVVACRPEYWEQAGALFPPGLLHRPEAAHQPQDPWPAGASYGACAGALPACVRLGALPPPQAERVRARYGLTADTQAAAVAGHPLALRLLAEVRAALPKGGADAPGPEEGAAAQWGGEAGATGTPDRHEIFDGYLDLVCLRIAVRIAAAHRPPLRGTAVRRLAAQVAGQVHEAARRCLGPGQGELDRRSFEEVFPWAPGWASAVLAEGLLVPAGTGYRFGHEEFGEWLQGAHLELDAALHVLVHGRGERGAGVAGGSGRLLSLGGRRAGAPSATSGSVPGAAADEELADALAGALLDDAAVRGAAVPGEARAALPVPGHRIGPVVQSLLLLARREGPVQLTRRLAELVSAATAPGPDAVPAGRQGERWWATRLLGEVLLRVPDATPYTGVLRLLADRITERSVGAGGFERTGLDAFGPWFWRRLPLPDVARMDLLRRLLPADGPRAVTAGQRGPGAAGPADREPARPAGRIHPPRISPEAEPGASAAASASASASGASAGPGVSEPRVGRRARPFAQPPRVRVHTADVPEAEAEAEPLREGGEAPPPPPPPSPAAPNSPSPGAELVRPAPRRDGPPRFLDTAAELLRADPARVQPLLCAWFDDTRPLQRATPAEEPPAPAAGREITVAAAAQALLHTHRLRALDDLTDALIDTAHPKAAELLEALAEDEPSAVCRAVDRWARDGRPERRAAAAPYGRRAAPHTATDTDRALLRQAALTLLSRSADTASHGPALALLIGDPAARSPFLDRALARFLAGDPGLPPDAFADALFTHPEPVLGAFRTRLLGGESPTTVSALLRVLAGIDVEAVPAAGPPAPPGLAARAAEVVRAYAEHWPDDAGRPVAEFVDRRLARGAGARTVLRPLVVELLTRHAAPVRCALAPVLAAAGCAESAPLRRELLDVLLASEEYDAPRPAPGGPSGQDTRVLEAVLRAAAEGAGLRPEERTRELVHRTGTLLVRTPEGAALFDRRLVELGRAVPGFARRVREWVAAEPGQWAALVGPGARATLAGCGS